MNQELILIISAIREDKGLCTKYSVKCHGIECENCILAGVYIQNFYRDYIVKMGERILCNNI